MNKFIEGIKQGDNCYIFSGNYSNTCYEILSNKSGVITLDLNNMTKEDIQADIQADKEYDLNKYHLEIDSGCDGVLYGIICSLDNKKILAIEVLINSELILENALSFKEAAEIWGISDSAIRKLVNTDKLKENVHYKKSGNTWIITRTAMRKIYGKEKG